MSDAPRLLSRAIFLIRRVRRRMETDRHWAELRALVEDNLAEICETFDTRWLTSLCDSYADHGDPIERRNGLLISVFVKMEKIGQTYAHWRLGYPQTIGTPEDRSHRKIDLWDGMTSFDLQVGDCPNSLFGRIDTMLAETPVLARIFRTIKARMKKADTILGNLNKVHRHVFENDFSWITADEYAEVRAEKAIGRTK